MNNSISVIIPSYNSAGTINLTLDSILAQRSDYVKEIIVVDSSDDPVFDKTIETYKKLGVIFLNAGIRVMPARGRNIGARRSSGRTLVFLDSDVIPFDNYILGIVTALERGYLAGGGGITIPQFQRRNAVALAQYYLQLNEYIPSGKDRVKPFLPGCNIFCDRKLFFECGGFPEIRASEDVLFGINISKITDLWFVPAARVSHIFRLEIGLFLKNQKMLGRYAALYRKKTGLKMHVNRYLSLMMIPGFFCIKLGRILPRIIKSGPRHILTFIIVVPVFTLGLLVWSSGFSLGISGYEHD